MDEKNLKIIRYLTGAMFIAMTLHMIQGVLSTWGAPIGASGASILGFVGALLGALAMFSGTYSLFAVGVGMLALHNLMYIFFRGAPFGYIFSVIAYILLDVAVFQRKKASIIGIICALMFLISDAIFQIIYNTWQSMIFYSAESAACTSVSAFLACMVLQNTPQTQTAKIKQPAIVQKTDNRIEELTKLKDLLDTGAITQDEFDAKKKQILGL